MVQFGYEQLDEAAVFVLSDRLEIMTFGATSAVFSLNCFRQWPREAGSLEHYGSDASDAM